MKLRSVALLALVVLAACRPQIQPSAQLGPDGQPLTLSEARANFTTELRPSEFTAGPMSPAQGPFTLVKYPSPVGDLGAYLTRDPGDGQKHPAIIWITGGDCNTVDGVWETGPISNEQSASAYRQAGIVMMFPSLRGGNDNPGRREGLYGEVDDILAAADYLSQQPYVDPDRIYLGGHSTGGTLVLLTSQCTDRFRAVFSLGPVEDIRGYEGEYTPFSFSDDREIELRSPIYWLESVTSPTYVIEGTEQSNISSLRAMDQATDNPQLTFLGLPGFDHFSVLAPANKLIAQSILNDTGDEFRLDLDLSTLGRGF
jgi:dipeptidyl aminopeptidase/acylaminoacyl peptidase